MDDLNDKLSKILNDPGSMEKVRQMAESILGEEETTEEDNLSLSGVDPAVLANIAGIIQKLNSAGDSRTALLSALKPLISGKRQARVDTAIKLLRLINILPYLKDSGILDIL